jgi:hypothetical protein
MINDFKRNKDEKYDFIVIAYRLEGEVLWRIAACPPPFENANVVLAEQKITPAELRLVCDNGCADKVDSISISANYRAVNRGWKNPESRIA